ncbi:MAG: NAD-glutamate dehydrogenase, partial [Gammaproteobacteria bacterium]|nr:NAD-glutamate dehydrogenase [Gammaproteobacteria bacterium]
MRRITDARERQIDKIVAAAAEHAKDKYPIDMATFIRAYYSDVSGEDLRDRKPIDLAGMALSHLAFAANRIPGISLVRAFNPSTEVDGWESRGTVLQLVNDDMPFIVDSAALVLHRQKMTIHVTIH